MYTLFDITGGPVLLQFLLSYWFIAGAVATGFVTAALLLYGLALLVIKDGNLYGWKVKVYRVQRTTVEEITGKKWWQISKEEYDAAMKGGAL